MYQVGEYLIYGFEGICRVEAIGHPKMAGVDRQKLYYTLMPLSGSGAIFTPIDTGAFMRTPIERTEAVALLADLEKLPLYTELPAESRTIFSYYQEVLQTHDCREILRLYKTLYLKQLSLVGTRKTLSSTNMRYLKQTEELICGELSFVLGYDSTELAQMLRKRLSAAATGAIPAP